MMDCDQADFFRSKLLPIIRECAEDRNEPPPHERNPIRPMLQQLLRYVDYLERSLTEIGNSA